MKDTPMMQQYLGFKRQYPDKIVLFRMGDFFETFGDDARTAAKVLNITLTARDKNDDPTPLAGFPHVAIDQYLPKFINAGYCVVVVDQIEDPKLAKGVVKRAVTRIVTPGTLDSEHSESVKNAYIVSLFRDKKSIGVAIMDLLTGVFKLTEILASQESIDNLLASFDPSEILITEAERELRFSNIPVQILHGYRLDMESAAEVVTKFYGVNSIEALGLESYNNALIAASMLVRYIEDTQKMDPKHISKPVYFSTQGTMILDRATIRNLDLVSNALTGGLQNTLFETLDDTKTRMGKRMLYSWILNPLLQKDEIESRLKVTQYFYANYELLIETKKILSNIADIERLVGKIGLNRANARDFKALEYSLDKAKELSDLFKADELSKYSLVSFFDGENSLQKLHDLIAEIIGENPGLSVTEGHIIKTGYSKEIDEIRSLSGDSKSWVKEFVEKERAKTGISSLKMGFNKVFGYYLEVTNAHKEKVPDYFIRKQTLVNGERYITQELKEKEDIILGAEEKLSKLEYEIFQKFRAATLPYLPGLQKLGSLLAEIDVLAGFSNIANNREYIKPELSGNGDGTIEIIGGRHPIIELITQEQFVSNDTHINKQGARMCILTGPNMSGKSTYIRQVALIVLMAQIGSFVPAKSAKISLVDRVFTRVGASDDLSRGRSTFMVEMEEASNILNNATKDSLVVLDEIGRGTSTFDGVSIAWALAEYLAQDIGARTLFATHYHELLALADEIPNAVRNYNVLVEEDEQHDQVIFLRKIGEGGTDKSYGIHVAKMAGLPAKVIARAKEILSGFEGNNKDKVKDKNSDRKHFEEENRKKSDNQLSFLAGQDSWLVDELKSLDLNNITPVEIASKVNEWKKRL